MVKLRGTIDNYFNRLKTYPNWRFVLEMTLLAFILKILFIIIFGIVFALLGLPTESDLSFEQDMAKNNFFILVFLLTIFASFETLTSQWFIIWLVSRFTNHIYWQILFSSLVFSILHWELFLAVTVFPIGILLAWSFIIKRAKSRWEAFWVTTAIHALHNLVATGLVWLAIR